MNEKTDDFFTIVYIILTELYASMRKDASFDHRSISPERFGIPQGYLFEIIWNLEQKNYITGPFIATTAAGSRIVEGMEQMKITMDGIEYLQENSTMKKILSKLKNFKDAIPGL